MNSENRLSAKAAERLMIEAGTKRSKRNAMAAAFILQGLLAT